MSSDTNINNQRFVEESQGDLLRFIEKRIHDKGEAQSIAQESYLKFFRAEYAADSDDARPLLFTIAKNLLNDHFRHKQRQDQVIEPNSSESIDLGPGNEKDPSEALDPARQLKRVISVIEHMPPKRQEVFKLSRFDGFKNREIAKRLKITTSMVEKHLAAALKDLRATLT